LSVELGVSGGGGSFHLAIGWPEGKVVGVDRELDHPANVNFMISHCLNFNFWQGDSVSSARLIYEEFGPVDLLFIDTIHTFERTMEEFKAWRPYLSEKAVVCFDDLLRFEMTGTWEALPEPKTRLDDLHPIAEGGFGVLWGFG
jgi:predicted O-methyltransferase YrrM